MKTADRDSIKTLGPSAAPAVWHTFIVMCAGLLLSASMTAALRAGDMPVSLSGKQSVFPPLVVAHTDELYKPALLKDGRVIAVALPTIEGVQRAVAIYSSDNGRTWGQPSTLFSLPGSEGTFGYYDFLVDRTGEMHFFFLLDPSTGTTHRQDLTKESELDIWYVKSSAGGTAWRAPKQIWRGRGGDLLSVIQLHSGRLLLPISFRTQRSWGNRGGDFDAFTYSGQFDSSALYSDDDGESWHQSPSVLRTTTPDIETIEGAVEPVALQLKDGRVWMLIRSQMGRFYESYSSDDGNTWSPAVPTSLISSDSPPALARLSDGRIVMFLNRNLRFPYAYGGRQVLHAAISDDEGVTWRGYREVVRDPFRQEPPPPGGDFGPAYPYPAVTKDDKVLFALACATGTRSGQPDDLPGFVSRQKRDLTLLDPRWLLETSQHTDFSNGLDDWSAFGVRGVEIIPNPTRSGSQVLSIRKIEARWPAAAVWNFPTGARGHLRLNLMLKPGFGGALIGLSDHYSVPYDETDRFYNVYNLAIGADGSLPNGEKLEANHWHHLDMDWDTAAGQGRVVIDGRQVVVLRTQHQSDGISYVRLRSTALSTDLAGFLVDSIEAEISPSGRSSESLPTTGVPHPESLHDAQAWIDELWYSQYDWPQLGRYHQKNLDAVPPAPGEQRVVFLGDSITDSWNLAQWFPGKPYLNRGIDGQTTPQMLVRFRADVIGLAPKVVVILAGTNDIAGNTGPTTLDAIEQNYASMADLATENGVAAVLSSLLPIHDHGPMKITSRRSPEKIDALNRWLQHYCADHHLLYLDYFSHMVGPEGRLRTELSDDGLHPNAAGFAVMKPLAEQAIEQALKPRP
jgi:lysophospholipase L1-like esterase